MLAHGFMPRLITGLIAAKLVTAEPKSMKGPVRIRSE